MGGVGRSAHDGIQIEVDFVPLAFRGVQHKNGDALGVNGVLDIETNPERLRARVIQFQPNRAIRLQVVLLFVGG